MADPAWVSAKAIEVDESLWPLVVIRYLGPTTPEAWEAMFATFERMHARRERFFTINDALYAAVPSALERSIIGRRTRELAEDTRRYLVGSAGVIKSAVIRGALTAIYWVSPPAYKVTLVATLPEAYVVAATALEAAGLKLHPEHRRLSEMRPDGTGAPEA